jgi:excisionase family DNA binding protein
MDNKALLTVKEFAVYLNIGKTKAYELLNDKKCTYCIKIGRRRYAHKGNKWDYSQRYKGNFCLRRLQNKWDYNFII